MWMTQPKVLLPQASWLMLVSAVTGANVPSEKPRTQLPEARTVPSLSTTDTVLGFPSATCARLPTKFAVPPTLLLGRKLMTTERTTPGWSTICCESAIQVAVCPEIAEQVWLNACPLIVTVPTGSWPSESPMLELPLVTGRLRVTGCDPLVAEIWMHWTAGGTVVTARCASPTGSSPPAA